MIFCRSSAIAIENMVAMVTWGLVTRSSKQNIGISKSNDVPLHCLIQYFIWFSEVLFTPNNLCVLFYKEFNVKGNLFIPLWHIQALSGGIGKFAVKKVRFLAEIGLGWHSYNLSYILGVHSLCFISIYWRIGLQ